MASKDIETKMKNFFGRFFSWKKDDVLRVHISHIDLDGYAAQVITEVANNAILGNRKRQDIHYFNVSRAAEIQGGLMDLFARNSVKSALILITDLGGVSASMIRALDTQYHGNITWCIIDHHKMYDDALQTLEYENKHVCMYVNELRCGSYNYFRTLCKYNHQPALRNMTGWLKLVDTYDTGHWGRWSEKEVSRDVMAQLEFVHYDRKDELLVWEQKKIDWFLDICDEDYTADGLDEEAAYDEMCFLLDDWEMVCGQIKRKMWDGTMPGTDLYSISDGSHDLRMRPVTLAGYDEISPRIRTRYFSMISRRYLEEHPDVDILYYVQYDRGAVHLRTNKEDIDVAMIAHANGGGGHQKAAGFPLPDEIRKLWAERKMKK